MLSSRGQGSGYIVLLSEYGPSDQTDIDRTVILDPFGRWSIIREKNSNWTPEGGRRPRPGPVLPPLRSHGFWILLGVR